MNAPDHLDELQHLLLAEAARDESGGRFEAVTDDQIMAAQSDLAAREGVFVEPASAAGIAGLLQALATGESFAGQTVVITVTGHGLKDPTPAEREVAAIIEAAPTVGSVSVALGW